MRKCKKEFAKAAWITETQRSPKRHPEDAAVLARLVMDWWNLPHGDSRSFREFVSYDECRPHIERWASENFYEIEQ